MFYGEDRQPLPASSLHHPVFYPALHRAGLRHVRIHDLRHTFASLLIQQGESLAYIRDQLDHHSIKITVDTYGYLVLGRNRQAVDRLDDPRPDLVEETQESTPDATIRNLYVTTTREASLETTGKCLKVQENLFRIKSLASKHFFATLRQGSKPDVGDRS